VKLRNIEEEIKEILNECINCGMCKSLCPVFKTLKLEELSPRAHTILLRKGIINELVYKCTFCKACEIKCPLNLKICTAMKKAREILVLQNKELKTNKEMMNYIRKKGTPFNANFDKNPDKLYCC
jgi:glycolate oxidase iron-sulfur subunit